MSEFIKNNWKWLLPLCLLLLGSIIAIILTLPKSTISPTSSGSSTILNTKIWQSVINVPSRVSSLKLSFPELCPDSNYGIQIPNINKVSIAISGGGSTSFCTSVGYFRALNRMGYKNKAQYVSTVSGGSWFYGLYSYCQSNPNFTDRILLGLSAGCINLSEIPNPSKMTMSALKSQNNDNSLYLGHVLKNKDILSYVVEALVSPNVPIDLAFNYGIGKLLLDPYGLNGDVPVSLNSKHAQDIMNRNSTIGKPLTLPDGMPFWLCNATLLFKYPDQYPYVCVQQTPLYSGLPQVITKNNNTIGGVLVENFAFGNTKPKPDTILSLSNKNCASINQSLDKTANIRTLRDMMANSGNATAVGAYEPQRINEILGKLLPSSLEEIIPKYNIWGTSSLYKTTSDSQCTSNILSGGCDVKYGYDRQTCTRLGPKCYSNTTQQCTKNSDCTYSFTKLECVNKNSKNSSLRCEVDPSFFDPFGCKCTKSSSYTPSQNNFLKSQIARIGDGVETDNTGIISLLSRGVKRIISFMSDDSTINQYYESCGDLLPLFGKANDSCKIINLAMNTAQVFRTEDFDDIFTQFNNNYNNDKVVFARSKSLLVLPNSNNGVSGGYMVDILFIDLNPCKKFLKQLAPDTLKDITSGSSFKNFPNYSVFFQNINLGLISLTLEQINLLTSYAEWCMYQPEIKQQIDEMFSY